MKEAKRVEAIDILHEQLAMVESLRREEKEAVKLEMASMNKKWRDEEVELKKQQEEKRCYQLARTNAINEQNKSSRCQKNQEYNRDKQFEADCMAMTSAREAAEALQEKELKDAQKREARQYADHLKAVMARLNADESARNAQFKAEEDAEWAKREAGWKREEDLRKRLWNRVHEERQQQLMEKERLRHNIESHKRSEMEYNEKMARMADADKNRQLAEHRKSKQGLLDELEEQIRNKQAATITAKEQKRVEFEGIVDQEKKYAEKVKCASATLPFHEPNFKHKLVKWYED